eukprot:TRINITY_DN1624_c0_g1_i1.p1 TRINITY_DN1624_c0_g1~~TRINITY_DN1624_c0_g1_i1.p1  ORF type:complete len:1596 (-),score=444.53 TRINITY_DN1624_c0_g1_i1:125-4912(-)
MAAGQNWVSDEFDETARVPARLLLKDGTCYDGWSFGSAQGASGEVVFNTGMVGYPESLTDPSYAGQILTITFPLVGNYGVADEAILDTHGKELDASGSESNIGLPTYFEGRRVHVAGLVVSEYDSYASHYTATRTLHDWLAKQGIPGIFGVDTRALTRRIRVSGAELGQILVAGGVALKMPQQVSPIPFDDPNQRNLAAEVAFKHKRCFMPPELAPGQKPTGFEGVRVLAVDCGMKFNIIRCLVNDLRVQLTVVPWDYDFSNEEFDGLFLSNGPGNPQQCAVTIENLRKVMKRSDEQAASGAKPIPIFGICLGNQLLALAAGATTYKMKFGNRGMNVPCVDLRTGRCYITPQNHGFAVDAQSLPADWAQWFVNANDGTNEGIAHRTKPWFSVQFHPEAKGGPGDTHFLFELFGKAILKPGQMELTTQPFEPPRLVNKVLVLGSGGLTIGQAGEFDYSGSQAIKALREQGVQSVLVNPNIATVQTSKGLADKVYLLPVTPEFVTEVIKKERPDGIMASWGGQTALNCAIALHNDGILAKYNVRVMGTQIETIMLTEDRELFKQQVEAIGQKVAEASVTDNLTDAIRIAEEIGYPVLVRAAFALGGLGSGFCNNEQELRTLAEKSFANAPQIIIDKSLRGWKELEYEVVRDAKDNCIVVCNMENFDPMGIHTGDSIVVAPSQTLSNAEYFELRRTSLNLIRHLGVVGECNVQYSLDPNSHEYRIIEVNARLSRSSALASKATGYPLAYIAAKLALGHDLVSLRNQVTKCTTACFEPSLDYVVVKIPRWDIQKFQSAKTSLGSQMMSVGEVMAIGRRYTEAMQKALRMVEERCNGFEAGLYNEKLQSLWDRGDKRTALQIVEEELANPTPRRVWAIARAYQEGLTVDQVFNLSKIDRWFLSHLFTIHTLSGKLGKINLQQLGSEEQGGLQLLHICKQHGFSDGQIAARLADQIGAEDVAKLRRSVGIKPCVKQIDTLAAEFPAQTNYLYITYNGTENDVEPLRKVELPGSVDSLYDSSFGGSVIENPGATKMRHKRPAAGAVAAGAEPAAPGDGRTYLVLGCGCYRIGSSVEFDWCSVNTVRTLRVNNQRAMVINCNPETVSTDYDESDRLYFEELSHETVSEICYYENPTGVIVSVGGQTPNNLATGLDQAGIPVMGTPTANIDKAEDRSKFSDMCDALGIDQPRWSQFTSHDEALSFARAVTFPVLVRPSYVLSGAAMQVVSDEGDLQRFLTTAAVVAEGKPVVISKYINNAREIEFDAVGCDGELITYAISEHVENAGCHSGDASLLLPSQKIFVETQWRIRQIGAKLCEALDITGPFNVQFLVTGGTERHGVESSVKVIECNVRASRTFPFISKTFDTNFIELATKAVVGLPVEPMSMQGLDLEFAACKVPVFSFLRLNGSDPRTGVEMQSTGEVACFGRDQYEAYLKALISANFKMPKKGSGVLLSLDNNAKGCFLPYAIALQHLGFSLYATRNTSAWLRSNGVKDVTEVYPTLVKIEPNAATVLREKKVGLTINTASSTQSSGGVTAGFQLRRLTVDLGIALISDLHQAMLFIDCLQKKSEVDARGEQPFWTIEPWQYYHNIMNKRTSRSRL